MVTDNEFKSAVDTIVAIIESSIQRKQPANSEKYINYLFKLIFECYSKGKLDFEQQTASQPEESFDKFQHKPYYMGHLDYKLFNLIDQVISPGNYESYIFLHKHLIDLMKKLIKKNAKAAVNRILFRYPLTITDLLSLGDQYTVSERKWYEFSSFTFFEELYPMIQDNIQDIEGLIQSFSLLLRNIIDFRKYEIFDHIINSIHTYDKLSSIGDSHFEDVIAMYAIDFDQRGKLYLLNIMPYTSEELSETKEHLENELPELNGTEIRSAIDVFLNDKLKYNYIRTALFSSVIYSFFKKEYKFFNNYYYAHQPKDADAYWAGKNVAFSIDERLDILKLKEELIEPSIVDTKHHGFTIYFNQVMGVYFVMANRISKPMEINRINSPDEADLIASQIKEIKNTILNVSYLKEIDPELEITKEVFDKILDANIDYVLQRKDHLEISEATSAKIAPEIIKSFSEKFIESFLDSAAVRRFYSQKIHSHLEEQNSDAFSIGINKVVPKMPFSKNATSSPLEMARRYGHETAVNENRSILKQIQQKCAVLNLKQDAFVDFMKANIPNFDLLISYSTYPQELKDPTINMINTWHPESNTEGIISPGKNWIGKVLDHYQVYSFSHLLAKNSFLLLNSQNLGQLHYYDPEDIPGNEFISSFKFSTDDLTGKDNSILEHLIKTNPNLDKTQLKKSIHLRIAELLLVKIPKEFYGILITVKDETEIKITIVDGEIEMPIEFEMATPIQPVVYS